jgi:hypothetical protein
VKPDDHLQEGVRAVVLALSPLSARVRVRNVLGNSPSKLVVSG